MPISIQDLIENPRRFKELSTKQPQCCECGVQLQETITGKRETPKGAACSDCYYELIGELIEKHPIVSAGVRRG